MSFIYALSRFELHTKKFPQSRMFLKKTSPTLVAFNIENRFFLNRLIDV